MDQLTLELESSEQASSYRLVVLKNDKEILSIDAGSVPHAQVMRRSLVEQLQRAPRNHTVWEENPRPTGWWGLLSGQPDGAAVYNIIIETTRTETDNHECSISGGQDLLLGAEGGVPGEGAPRSQDEAEHRL